MFEFLKKKVVAPDDVLAAPIKGMAVPSSSINDPTFGQEMLGKGMAIEPSEGKLYSPIDGSVALVIDTKHALSIVSDNGAEILMHVGLDTVKLKGKYFTPKVSVGDKVKKGDLILEFDIDALKGEGIVKLGGVGAGLYAFFNRLLIPTGLHHALNNVFWFDTIGLGDLTNFWGGKTSADVSWSLGMYMSGFFPCMMFGVPGAALAMLHCAKDNKKKVAAGLLLSAAICAFVCGVTEPFEFGFMFLAPVLYLIYAILYGIFTVITYYVGFRAGFSFSAGCTDLVFSSTLPAASKTWLIIPLGIAAFIVFYVVFRFAITKFDLKTPGREDDDVEAEKQAELGNNDYTQVASIILEGIGGKENVVEIDNCITRLRLEVKDNTIVDEKKIKSAGVAGVLRPGKNNVQVIIGTKVQFVADEFKKLCK